MRRRIHLVPETPATGPIYGCAQIRLLRPYHHELMNKIFHVTHGRYYSGGADIVVTQRAGPSGYTLGDIFNLVNNVRQSGALLVFDLDDNLMDLHHAPEVESGLSNLRDRVFYLLRSADLVTVSTKALADRVSTINRNVAVWRNGIDEALILPRSGSFDTSDGSSGLAMRGGSLDGEAEHGAVKNSASSLEGADVGYFGTLSHLEDLMWISSDLRASLFKLSYHPHLDLCGISGRPEMGALFSNVAKTTIIHEDANYIEFMQRMQRIPNWKVGLAPLSAASNFNKAKSDIKFLDYSAFGVPGVYGDEKVYDSVEHEVTGLVAEKHPGGWSGAIDQLLSDRDLRESIRKKSFEHLIRNRTIGASVGLLSKILTDQHARFLSQI